MSKFSAKTSFDKVEVVFDNTFDNFIDFLKKLYRNANREDIFRNEIAEAEHYALTRFFRQPFESLELDNVKKIIENNILNAKSTEQKERALFISNIVKSIDVSKMPHTLQSYIISSIFNPNGTQFNDFDMHEQIKEFVIRREKADTIIKESQSDIAKGTAEKTLDDLTTIRNNTKRE